MLGLIGKKIGMTQLFAEDGGVVPVTAIEAGPCPIVQIRTDERDGYRAVQLGFGRKKASRSTKAASGHTAVAGLDYVPAVLREFHLGPKDKLAADPHTPGAGEAAEGLRVGQVLTVTLFETGERVKVTGRTKGRGFQGVVKRHRFAGGPGSHGQPSIRVPGSVGPGTDPSRVIKGRRMGGHMGDARKTVRNLTVVRVDPERNVLFVKGAVPGARNSLVFVGKR
jgi:large subunit ribosomal protein L3